MSTQSGFRNYPSLTRRRFLQCSGLGAIAVGLSACTGGAVVPNAPSGAHAQQSSLSETVDALLEFRLTAKPAEVNVLPGTPTQVLRYSATVVQGDSAALTALPDSYLGPLIRVERGQTMRVTVRNEVGEPTNLHWHGLVTPPDADGHPANAIEHGTEGIYEFEVRNRAGTYWFHPHAHELTAEQAYRGLAGVVIVTEPEEAALGLPSGEFDLPLVIQDRRFDGDNQFAYIGSGMAGMMDSMMGILGDHILVNGRPDYTVPVATRPYRLRILNGSNARIYKLGWGNGTPITVIGSDGGLLAQPITLPYVMLAPGERVEVWADFSQEAVGTAVKLVSLAFEGVEMGMMGGMMHSMPGDELPNGTPFDVMTFNVSEAVTHDAKLPATLLPVEALPAGEPARSFVFAMDDGMNWTINGRRFEMHEVADDEKVRFGDTEVWELSNLMAAPAPTAGGTGGMDHGAHAGHTAGSNTAGNNTAGNNTGGMMGQDMRDFMAHPVHLHGVQFQVLQREVDPALSPGWDTVKEGFVDQGWKDTVLLMPGERIRIALRFDGYRGVYLFHCHNLEHEDTGMMRNFEIV